MRLTWFQSFLTVLELLPDITHSEFKCSGNKASSSLQTFCKGNASEETYIVFVRTVLYYSTITTCKLSLSAIP